MTALGIGLGVGIPLGLIAIALLIYLPLRYRQKRRVEEPAPPYEPGYGADWKQPPGQQQQSREGSTRYVPEMGPKTPRVEMYTEREAQEMPVSRF